MRGNRARQTRKHATSVLAIIGALIATKALPQESGRPLLTFNFAQSLEISDNPNFIADPTGTTLNSRTFLGFALSSGTSTENLLLRGGVDLLYELATNSDEPSNDGIDNEFIQLSYGREAANARLGFDALYSISDVGDLRFVDIEDGDGFDLVLDEGSVERTQFGLNLETGVASPVGLVLGANYSRRVYTDTTDPSLVDDETFGANARLRFSIDRITSISAVARYSRDQELEGSDYERETVAFGLRVDREFSDIQSGSLEVTSDTIDTTDGGITTEEDGYSVRANYRQETPRGNITLSASSVLENIGTRNTLRYSQRFDLPDGAFSYFLGVTNNDTSDLNPIFGATYQRQLRTGSISVNARQIVRQRINSDEETRDRVLSISYSDAINSVSSWSTRATFADSDNLTTNTDTQRADFEVSYSRDLAQDWRFVSGYRYERSRSSTEAERDANTVFFTLRRDFAVRP